MKRKTLLTATTLVAALVTALIACASPRVPDASAASSKMSFFITSVGRGKGADLGGLVGADKQCQELAQAVGAGTRTWHAYLSTNAANAKDRIGNGPWFNAKGVQVAASVADLHTENNKLGKENSLNEKGEVVNGRGDTPNRHDMLTGSQLDGTAFTTGDDMTCQNWTSSGDGAAQLGHHDRQGGGQNPNSWNSAHPSKGCGQEALRGTGGDGLFYCFAIN